MPFRDIFGQEHAIDLLKQAVRRDRMPHAWLFTGKANIGNLKLQLLLHNNLTAENVERTHAESVIFVCRLLNKIFSIFRC